GGGDRPQPEVGFGQDREAGTGELVRLERQCFGRGGRTPGGDAAGCLRNDASHAGRKRRRAGRRSRRRSSASSARTRSTTSTSRTCRSCASSCPTGGRFGPAG